MRCSLLLAVALVALCLCGCKSGTNVVGKWKGKIELSGEAAKNPMAAQMAQTFSPTLDLKSDKTFDMQMGMAPMSGTYELSGDTLTLKTTKIMGMDMEAAKKVAAQSGQSTAGADKPLVLKVSSDGKTLTAQSADQAQGSMTFQRQN